MACQEEYLNTFDRPRAFNFSPPRIFQQTCKYLRRNMTAIYTEP
jgi:hypothetical protein